MLSVNTLVVDYLLSDSESFREDYNPDKVHLKGKYCFEVTIPPFLLNKGIYSIHLDIRRHYNDEYGSIALRNVVHFEVVSSEKDAHWRIDSINLISLPLNWKVDRLY